MAARRIGKNRSRRTGKRTSKARSKGAAERITERIRAGHQPEAGQPQTKATKQKPENLGTGKAGNRKGKRAADGIRMR